ncbi:hypothetical protein RAH41_11475 [Gottfriedia acidiceleris]
MVHAAFAPYFRADPTVEDIIREVELSNHKKREELQGENLKKTIE